MARKIWMIGVGGSGSKTLRFAKASLERRLSKVDGYEGFPAGWRFLSIDLPKDLEVDNSVPSDLSENSEYIGVAPPAKEYRIYDASLTGRSPVRDEFVRWRPNPESVTQPPWLGAGQFRAIGRTVLLDQLAVVNEALQVGYGVLTSLSTRQDFHNLNTALGSNGGNGGNPLVVVVGSVAGGTGAGTFLDVSDLISAAIPQGWATTHSAFLYTPGVFDSLAEGARTGIEANSYWAVSELLNAAWDTRPELPHLIAAGVPGANAMRRGAPYNFLIGREAEVQLSDPNAVYRAVGEFLAQLAIDDEFASNFATLTIGNFAAQGHRFRSGVLETVSKVPVAGLGFSRFGLGRDRFEDYAVDRLVRASIDHIVLAHEMLAKYAAGESGDPGDNRADKIATILNQNDGVLVGEFVKELGLDENGDHNDVLDVLLPVESFEELIVGFRKKVEDLAQDGVRGLARFDSWLTRVEAVLDTQRGEFLDAVEKAVLANASKLATDLPERFSEVVSGYVRRYGGWVTLELLKRLDAELTVVLAQLPPERSAREASASAAGSTAWAQLGDNRREGRFDSDVVQKAIAPLFDNGIRGQVGVLTRTTAMSLLSNFRTSLLRPFTARFAETLEALTAYRESSEFRDLSSGPVADRLRPAETEILLVDVDDYPDELDRLLRATIGDVSAPVEEAAKLLLDDRELPASALSSKSASADHRLASLGEWRWTPERVTQVPQQQVGFSAEALCKRASLYLHKDLTSGIGQYLVEDLSTYLDRCDNAGLENFKTRFRLAIDVAKPLLAIDESALTHLYSQAPSLGSFTTTPLPLPTGTAGRLAAQQVLLAVGVDATNLDSYFANGALAAIGGARVSSISISSQTAPVHPAAVRDLRGPVLRKWRQGQTGFASTRRARSRVETIPLQRSVLRQIVAGRELGRFLGLVSVNAAGSAYEVLDEGVWRALPNFGPEGAAQRDTELFQVALEAYGMELLEHADTGMRADALRCYDVLFEVGAVTGLVEHWVNTGELPDNSLGLEADVASDVDGRRELLSGWLTERRRELEADSAELAQQEFATRRSDFARLGIDAINYLLDDALPRILPAVRGAGGARRRG